MNSKATHNSSIPAISVIVPVYNQAAFLPKCLNSIRQQSFSDFEVLVINDGSVDDSQKIIEKFKHSDSRFHSLINSENKGPGQSRNLAISEASGKYLLFVDSDDWIHPKSCEILYANAEKYSLDLLIGKYVTRNQRDETEDGSLAPVTHVICNTGERIFYEFDVFTAVWDKFWLREFVLQNNLKNNEEHIFEDIPFTVKGLITAKKAGVIDFPFYFYYRGNRQSITQKQPPEKHLADREWAIDYLLDLIFSYREKPLEKPLKKLLAKQLLPALGNIRNFSGENQKFKKSLFKKVVTARNKVEIILLTIKTIPFAKRIIIYLSPAFFNVLFCFYNKIRFWQS